jgi:dihydrofolate reductase
MSVPIALIAAVAENGVIGVGGGLPWRLKADLKKFRSITMGKPVVMGRKTFDSIGRTLDGRDVIVVTRQKGFAPPGVLVAASLKEAISVAEARAKERGADEIMIGGGGEVYAEALPLAERLYVTHVAVRPLGDTRFPDIELGTWAEVSREALAGSEGDTAAGVHVVYRRRR